MEYIGAPRAVHCESVIRQPYKSPLPGGRGFMSKELAKYLAARRKFVPWGQTEALCPLPSTELSDLPPEDVEDNTSLPPGVEPLVLWEPVEGDTRTEEASKPIVVENILAQYLRAHQREGVQFMFECVAGLRQYSHVSSAEEQCNGCILADDMGLGKTLQSITLLWTLLRQGFDGEPMVKRALIVTPTSLVSNWENELKKWLEGRVNVLAMCESTRSNVIKGIADFLAPRSSYQVMIISYETFRIHASRFHKPGSCDLLICDEAHRLKNDKTLTNQALTSLPCRRRILLSGTPMQNDLEEFYSMVNFTNPGVLGDYSSFRKHFEHPILLGREPEATDEERVLSAERSSELSERVNQFILRRTNALLSQHLPPKVVEIVCCKLSDLQLKLYQHFINSKDVKKVFQDGAKRSLVLSSITAIRKLCNHPKLIYDTVRTGGSEAAGFKDCLQYFPQEMVTGRHGQWSGADGQWVDLSGKMAVLARLLAYIRYNSDDRIVLVSNYTQTLDLFAAICRDSGYPYVRLDGTTSISKRQKLVQRFNDHTQNEFAFLLSSKAGGCGLNLIGGNRLVLFDPDWNPANDKQAAARVWRDGQRKRVYIYRFLAAGTIEEKVFQRQLSKEGLQQLVDGSKQEDERAQVNAISSEDLRDLFTLRDTTRSDTHDSLNCQRCNPPDGTLEAASGPLEDIGGFAEGAGCSDRLQPWETQIRAPAEEDLKSWAHHASPSTVPDTVMQQVAGNDVAFVFTCQVEGKLAPVNSFAPTTSKPQSAKLGSSAVKQGAATESGPRRPLGNLTNKIRAPFGSKLSKRPFLSPMRMASSKQDATTANEVLTREPAGSPKQDTTAPIGSNYQLAKVDPKEAQEAPSKSTLVPQPIGTREDEQAVSVERALLEQTTVREAWQEGSPSEEGRELGSGKKRRKKRVIIDSDED